jgi:tRNA U55 pseudouridine synthase TruB
MQKLVEEGGEFLLPLEAALPHLPLTHLTAEEARRVRHGAAVGASVARATEDGAHVSMFDEGGALLAVGIYDAAAGLVRPRVMLAPEK